MKKNLLALALVPCLTLLSGCASSSDHGAYAPIHTNINNLEDSARFVLLDPQMQQAVTCVSIQESRLPDNRLQVSANLRNMLNRRLQIQVNCQFKDAQGFPVEETSFQNMFLDENAQEGVTFAAASDKAIRYTIRARQAR